jgi:hypothetical protein
MSGWKLPLDKIMHIVYYLVKMRFPTARILNYFKSLVPSRGGAKQKQTPTTAEDGRRLTLDSVSDVEISDNSSSESGIGYTTLSDATLTTSYFYTDQDVANFITGNLTGDSRQKFVEELKTNSTLRKNCIYRREQLSELEITISAEAARAFNSGLSYLNSGNRNFPGHQYNDYGVRANESVFIEDRERFYASARNSFEKLLELHELEDLALANLAIIEENVKNAPIAAQFYPSGRHNHFDRMVQQVQKGEISPTQAVFGKPSTPTNKKGQRPPSWVDGIPLKMQADDRPIENLLELDFNNPNNTRQLIRRLNEFIPQGERSSLISFDPLKPIEHQERLISLMKDDDDFVASLIDFIEQPLPGGNDQQLSKLNESRIVAYRLLIIHYLESNEEKVFSKLKDLFMRQVDKFRAKDTKGWETNWFYGADDILLHYADKDDKLWGIVTEIFEKASEMGFKEFFSGELQMYTFIWGMEKMEQRFVKDSAAREFVMNKLIICDDKKHNDCGESISLDSGGVRVLAAFPEKEKFDTCIAILDGSIIVSNRARSLAIRHLEKMGKDALLRAEPEIINKLAFILEVERSLYSTNTNEDDSSSEADLPIDIEDLWSLSKLVYAIDPDEGARQIEETIELFISQDLVVDSNLMDKTGIVEFCIQNNLDHLRPLFEKLYVANDMSSTIEKMREWGTGDADLAKATLERLQGTHHSNDFDKAYCEITESLKKHNPKLQTKTALDDASAWSPVVAHCFDNCDKTKFVELILQDPYRHLLTPSRVENILNRYTQGILKDHSEWEQHTNSDLASLHDSLLACAHLPETRPHLIRIVEDEIRKFNSTEAIEANPKNDRLLYFLMELHNKATAMELKEIDGQLDAPFLSWLFFSKQFNPPKEVANLIFEYCLNDRNRSGVNVTNSYDSGDQMEAVIYADKIFGLHSEPQDSISDSDTTVSLSDLESYLIHLTNRRKLPLPAIQAAYDFSLPHLKWGTISGGGRSRKSPQELIELTKFPVLGLTSGSVNHRGPLFKGLSNELLDLYQSFKYHQKGFIFGEEDGQDPDLQITFLLSALFRVRAFDAIDILRDYPIEDQSLYAKVARFASMGAAEAIEDNDNEHALEMLKVLDEIIDLVPDQIKLEGMVKSDFKQRVRSKIEQFEELTRNERDTKTKQAIERNPDVVKKMETLVSEKIEKARSGKSIDFEHLRGSMLAKVVNGKPFPYTSSSFGDLSTDICKALGCDVCQEIGERVCREMDFTVEELDKLKKDYELSDDYKERMRGFHRKFNSRDVMSL